ncbi:uncharacterized protein LOC133692769 [Populus nigra]|uniref:uncharacterized protein LOC133692769 n=1 Tax=Populus nigra TaxID=3691 RepID=UPI002B26FABC|nr:uncharacterized protein LOC133692769 [Populus nigra]
MDVLIGTSKASCHVRSISLPSESHPLTQSVKVRLGRLRSSQETSSLNCQGLSGLLRSLYESVDDFIQLPLTYQAISNVQHQGSVDEVLDRSLRLLEKMISKSKSFRSLKTKEKDISVAQDKDTTLVTLTREVEEISVAVFASLLSSISLTPKSKGNGWSVVSKLLKSRSTVDAKEVGMINAEVLAWRSSKDISLVQVQNLLKHLEASQSSIQEVEEELEFAYRLLLKTRVSLLNILTH